MATKKYNNNYIRLSKINDHRIQLNKNNLLTKINFKHLGYYDHTKANDDAV